MADQPVFGRRREAPQQGKASAPVLFTITAGDADLGLDRAWTDSGEITAWKKERRQKMSLAMGWRRTAYVACLLFGLAMRTLSHDHLIQLCGVGLSGLGLVLLIAGRMRYARSVAPSAPMS